MITYDLLLVIFALFGVILTLCEHEYLVSSGDIIVCLCFAIYLVLFILWQSTEMKVKKKQLNAKEDFVKYLKEQAKEKINE